MVPSPLTLYCSDVALACIHLVSAPACCCLFTSFTSASFLVKPSNGCCMQNGLSICTLWFPCSMSSFGVMGNSLLHVLVTSAHAALSCAALCSLPQPVLLTRTTVVCV